MLRPGGGKKVAGLHQSLADLAQDLGLITDLIALEAVIVCEWSRLSRKSRRTLRKQVRRRISAHHEEVYPRVVTLLEAKPEVFGDRVTRALRKQG